MELPVTDRHIIGDEIAEDMLRSLCRRNMLCRRADHDAELDFIIELIRDLGLDDAIERDRKSVVEGKSETVRVDHGGRRIIKTKRNSKALEGRNKKRKNK